MMIGVITPLREAALALRVEAHDGTLLQVQVVIDTGFTDYLTLPADLIAALGLTYIGSRSAELADGSVVPLGAYSGRVEWNGRMRDIQALEADSDPVIGMGLLYGSRVTMVVIDGGPVTIEDLP
jgi:clan AA aspartic protease